MNDNLSSSAADWWDNNEEKISLVAKDLEAYLAFLRVSETLDDACKQSGLDRSDLLEALQIKARTFLEEEKQARLLKEHKQSVFRSKN